MHINVEKSESVSSHASFEVNVVYRADWLLPAQKVKTKPKVID